MALALFFWVVSLRHSTREGFRMAFLLGPLAPRRFFTELGWRRHVLSVLLLLAGMVTYFVWAWNRG